jgi:dihydrofolate reductase
MDVPVAYPMLTIIAAVGANGVIGQGGRLPFHLPNDMARLKNLTMGKTIIMGRKTWDSLPPRVRPLPGRRNLVLTHQHLHLPGAECFTDLASALQASKGQPTFIFGGAAVYAAALPLAQVLELTEVESSPAGDVYFPDWNRKDFLEVARFYHPATPTTPAYSFVTYHRNAG